MGYSIFSLCALISKVFSNYSIAVILRCWSPFLQRVLLPFLGLFFVCPCTLTFLFSIKVVILIKKIKTFNIHFLFSVRRNYKPRHKNEKRLYGQSLFLQLIRLQLQSIVICLFINTGIYQSRNKELWNYSSPSPKKVYIYCDYKRTSCKRHPYETSDTNIITKSKNVF